MRRGGAEGVLSQILGNTSRKDREIILICLEDNIAFPLPKDVKVISLFKKLGNDFSKFSAVFWGAWKLKKIINRENIDLVVSFMEREFRNMGN